MASKKALIPPFLFLLVLAFLSVVYFVRFIASASSYLLLLTGIRHSYIEPSQIAIFFPDKGLVVAVVDWRCSGAISILVYGSIFVATIFPMEGDYRLKLLWLFSSCAYFVLWNIVRLWASLAAGFYYGSWAFTAIHAFIAPIAELFCFVAIWAIAARSTSYVA